MTVEELIEVLQKEDPEALIDLSGHCCGGASDLSVGTKTIFYTTWMGGPTFGPVEEESKPEHDPEPNIISGGNINISTATSPG